MPFKREKYPSNWEEFSRFIRFERAENRCEKCGVPNYAIIHRTETDWDYWELDESGIHDREVIRGEHGYGASKEFLHEVISHELDKLDDDDPRPTVIMLTVAHLDRIEDICKCESQTGMKCAIESHVLALCQRCHLLYDIERHKFNRRRNQAEKVMDWRF